jgi:chemotaxis-related protein WspB
MLVLTFRAAGNDYALEVRRVVEVVPRINLREIPHAPDCLLGLFDYRGVVVPVVDLGILLGASPCQNRLSTRIILVESQPELAVREVRPGGYGGGNEEAAGESGLANGDQAEAAAQSRDLLGLVAEQVSDVAMVHQEQVISTEVQLPGAPYLGPIVRIENSMFQLILAERILDDSLRDAWFGGGWGKVRSDRGHEPKMGREPRG